MDKKEAITVHVKKRFKQRFDIDCNRFVRRAIIRAIQNHECEKISKTSCARSVYRVKVGSQEMNVVYDNRRKKIVTCLYIQDEIKQKECRHDWVEISQATAVWLGIYHAGLCYHVEICSFCGKDQAYDSSG